MNILFVHQNFPAQFKHLAPKLALMGHHVTALTLRKLNFRSWRKVKMITYSVSRESSTEIHPWASEFESKVIRGEACFTACRQLKENGYRPNVIIAHPGWGEALFLKQVWPDVKIGQYFEFFYSAAGTEADFDPEFSDDNPENRCRLQMKNVNSIINFDNADAVISPTHWQTSVFPKRIQKKIRVIHDGIETDILTPNPGVSISLDNKINLTPKDKIITFVNRTLEPLRGYHIFMRALPEILQRNPEALVLIIGGSGTGYGAEPPPGKTWKEIFFNEVKDRIDSSRVFFLGNIAYDQFVSVLQISTVHVYLTYPFILSWSLLEAMSLGCTIVASDTKPLHEALTHGETGRLVKFFDTKDLAENVTELLNNGKERERLGENARQFAIRTYDLKRVCLPAQVAWVNDIAAL